MKISFLYSEIVVLKNCVRKFLFISSFRWYGDFFDDCNIFLNCLSELLFIIKISNFETDVLSYVLWKFEKNWLKPAGEQLVWKSVITVKFFWRKLNLNITFSMFSYCSKMYFIKLCEFSTFFVETWSDSRTSLMLSWKRIKTF
jgi:hypothetical protein